jgi:hypothetical protein
MYQDKDLWPVKCPECHEEFVAEVGRMKAGEQLRCPAKYCALSFWYPTRQFLLTLAEAEAGRIDPWRDMIRLQKPM